MLPWDQLVLHTDGREGLRLSVQRREPDQVRARPRIHEPLGRPGHQVDAAVVEQLLADLLP
eukprot:8499734-Pyramimonas_sp.AAC.1